MAEERAPYGTAAEVEALDALLHIAEQKRLQIEEEVTPSLFPLFHWTERCMRAHIATCFAAFAMLRGL